MTTMRAVDIKGGTGPASSLFINDKIPKPWPKPEECLVKVKAFGLNRADTLQREGKYPVPVGVTPIMGLEFSGVIEQVGQEDYKSTSKEMGEVEGKEGEGEEGKEIWKPGDQVYGLVYGGAYAEYVIVHQNLLLRKPQELTWEECAAVPEVWMTALQALHLLGEYSPEKTSSILWHAGASSVSLAGIQLSARLSSSSPPKIYSTARQAMKCDFLTSTFPLAAAVNSTKSYPTVEGNPNGDWADEILRLTGGKGIDLVIDFIGAPFFSSNLRVLAKDGRCVTLGIMGGTKLPAGVDISPFVTKRVSFVGSTLRSRDVQYQGRLRDLFSREVVPGLKEGVYKAGVDRVVSWKQIGEAHLALEGNETKGKIVCLVD